MPNRTDQGTQQPTPVADDLYATAPQLLARAAVDYVTAQAAAQTRDAQGGPGTRQGILHGESN
jgi:hypothetical protein